jgi:putative hydrolase of HD superfamily
MKNLINFFIEAGKIKRMKQRGLVFRGVKEPVTVASHSFRETLMAWVLGKIKNPWLNTEKLIKITLVRDLCAGCAGDITPYDSLFPKNGKPDKKIFEKWPRFSKKEKEAFFLEKHKKDWTALKKLTSKLPANIKREMRELWLEYEKGLSKEGRFIQQVDMLENLIQALEYWQEDKKFPIEAWWHQMKELTHDPILLELLEELDKKFHAPKRKKGAISCSNY